MLPKPPQTLLREVYAALRSAADTIDAQKAEIERLSVLPEAPEPVAWVLRAIKDSPICNVGDLVWGDREDGPFPVNSEYWECAPLYLGAPPSTIRQEERLTDAAIIELRDQALPSQGEAFDCIAFARLIESAIREEKKG